MLILVMKKDKNRLNFFLSKPVTLVTSTIFFDKKTHLSILLTITILIAAEALLKRAMVHGTEKQENSNFSPSLWKNS